MIGQTVPCHTSAMTRSSCKYTPKPVPDSRTGKALALVLQLTALILLLGLSSVPAFAQTSATGAIVGTVTDQQGAVVPGAEVAITDKSLNVSTKTTTNSAGHY